MRFSTLLMSTLVALFVVPADLEAAIYKYTDDSGRMVFVDDADKIPPRFRTQADSIEEQSGNLAVDQADDTLQEQAVSIADPSIEAQARTQTRLEEKRRSYQTPVMISGNRVMIPAEVAVGNRTAHLVLLLDTGATATVLHRQSLSGLELPKGEMVKGRLAGGQSFSAEKVSFGYIEIGPFHMLEMPAMVITNQGPQLPFDGMLGMDFLKDHPYRIDYERERVIWEFQN
ncbi:MAG: hypothetical protein C0614_00805 [Desulfuromonas sp.]|nr:MAG: hypothetical protein C0614_00805 [Desulfuromonas sp.]